MGFLATMEGSRDLRRPYAVEIVDCTLSTGWPDLLASLPKRREICRDGRKITLALT
jgi:hypothetical protein